MKAKVVIVMQVEVESHPRDRNDIALIHIYDVESRSHPNNTREENDWVKEHIEDNMLITQIFKTAVANGEVAKERLEAAVRKTIGDIKSE